MKNMWVSQNQYNMDREYMAKEVFIQTLSDYTAMEVSMQRLCVSDHMTLKDLKKIVTFYLGMAVQTKMYSLPGEKAAVEALQALDGELSLQIYEMYRDNLPPVSDDAKYGTMELEVLLLEKTRDLNNTMTQMLNEAGVDNDEDTEDEDEDEEE